MKTTPLKWTVASLAGAALLLAPAMAQTNYSQTAATQISGTYKMAAGKVVGTNSGEAGLISPMTVVATVSQPTTFKASFGANGSFSESLSFVKYAFGNKEILQLALGTNKITGYSLSLSNEFADGLGFRDIVNDGTVLAYTTVKTNDSQPAGEAFSPNIITESEVEEDVTTNALVFGFTLSGKNDQVTARTEKGFAVFTPNLDIFVAGCDGVGSYSAVLKKHVFGKGADAETNFFDSSTFSGSFSGLFTEAPPEE